MADLPAKTLRQRNPAYDGKEIEECRALYAGGKAWRALAERFIPVHDVEPDDVYKKRVASALYVAHAGAIADMLAAYLFTEPPTLADVPSDWWKDWTDNVDGAGTSLAWWARGGFADALIGRRAWCWVNLPKTPEAGYANLAEQDAAGGRNAFLVELCTELVIDWGYDEQGRLAWIMVEDQVERRTDVTAERAKVLRWRYIDATKIRTWEWTPSEGKTEPAPDDVVPEKPEILHGGKKIPVAELCLPEGLWALGKMHDPAIAHLRARNSLSWALARGAHPLLTISALDKKTVTLGAGYFLALGLGEKAEYVEPGGTSFELLADDVGRLREDLYRVVHQMAVAADPSAQAAKQSGESKDSDWQSTEIVLSAYSEIVLDWIRQILELVALVRGEEGTAPTVTGLAGWQVEDLTEWLGQAALSVDARTMSQSFRKVVAKRETARLLADEPPEVIAKINAEIDAAAVVDDSAIYSPAAPEWDWGGRWLNPRRNTMKRTFFLGLLFVCLGCGFGAYSSGDIAAACAPFDVPAELWTYAAPVLPVLDAVVEHELVDVAHPAEPGAIRRTTSGPGIGQWRRA